MRESCFIEDLSLIKAEELEDLESCSSLQQNVNLVLLDAPNNIYGASGQINFAHDVFCKGIIEETGQLISSVMAPEAPGLIFCFDLMFLRWNRGLCRQTER